MPARTGKNTVTPQRSLGSTFLLSETTGERWRVEQSGLKGKKIA
jgi:hypothetical protein